MTILEKTASIQQKTKTTLCVGLDTMIERLPAPLPRSLDGLVEFNKIIIEATSDCCSSYKVNFAFYERYGSEGFKALERTRQLLPDEHISIADAKRGDMGYTAESYAHSILKELDFDSITVNPYMGFDTVESFLAYPNKLVFILALTSNPGSDDFQNLLIDNVPLYRVVMRRALQWKGRADRGFVIGATHPHQLAELRQEFPNIPLLIPGVGTQGADPAEIREANGGGIAFVNSSRAILYASKEADFAEKAREVALQTASQLSV